MEYQTRRRRIHPRTRPEDGLWPFPQLRRWRSCSRGSCPTVNEVLTKAQFLSSLLYQIHCIGPVGFGFAHIYSERHPRPKRDPTRSFCLFDPSNFDLLKFCPQAFRRLLFYIFSMLIFSILSSNFVLELILIRLIFLLKKKKWAKKLVQHFTKEC